MPNLTFNIAKGRIVELYNRVKTNDPANAALIVVALATTGLETDAVLIDKATLADVLSGTTDEATNTGYVRKVLTDVEIAAFTPDNVNDRTDLTIPNQTWTAVAAGSGWSKIIICYDSDTTVGTDANIIPLTMHDFVVVPDGSDITAQVAVNGFFRAA